MNRAVVAIVLELIGVIAIAIALFGWMPLVALAFVGIALIVFAQTIERGNR